MKSIFSVIGTLKQTVSKIHELNVRMDDVRINQGVILAGLNEGKESKRLKDYEFKVFSQWGEDGIIQRLTNAIDIKNKTFIEFGVEDFVESNCRFLLVKDNWSGFVIDGSASNIHKLKKSYFYWKYELVAIDSFITAENINELLSRSGFSEDLGIMSIDLDGVDYHVLDAIKHFRPRIMICEYNSVFGGARKISVPYDAGFNRSKQHYSSLYWGASLAAVAHLAETKGYSLVGTNSAGSNAFFVRNDVLNSRVEVLNAEEAFFPSTVRESRDMEGNLTCVSGEDRLKMIKGLPVLNIETNAIEPL